MKYKNHILVIRLSAMGDVAMTVPVLRAFIEQNPTTKITVLSRAFLKPLFSDLENVYFYAADVNGKHKGFFGLFKLYKELKELNIDAVADLHNVLRSKVLRSFFKLSSVQVGSIDKGRKEKRALTSSKNKVLKQLKTTHQRYADVFESLGFKINLSNPKFPVTQNLSDDVINISGPKNNKWIGIAPFAQYNSKMYPIDLMERVISNLSNKENLTIFLFGGGKKEVDILNKIAQKYPNTINVAGRIKLDLELNLISNLDLMLSMDSGNAHFGAMLGIKTLTIWGITHPFTGFAPFNQPFEFAILPDLVKYPNIPCSIYGNKVCEGYEDAMRSISPETITNKIIQTL